MNFCFEERRILDQRKNTTPP